MLLSWTLWYLTAETWPALWSEHSSAHLLTILWYSDSLVAYIKWHEQAYLSSRMHELQAHRNTLTFYQILVDRVL